MEQTSQNQRGGGDVNPVDTTGLCLLSLDGGGVRGLSTLYILKGVMDRLNDDRKKGGLEPTKPCEVFDLIGGTSTGGLIAIMLGRLEMDVDECIAAYSELAKSVFETTLHTLPFGVRGKVKPRFDSEKLKDAILKIVVEHGESEDDLLNDGRDRGCKTFVCAADRNTKSIVHLRDYGLPHEPQLHAKIWEAALATSAATTFFAPTKIGNRSFGDGGLGANNPVDEVEGEASNIWCHDTGELKPLVKCFLSIGTGNPGIKPYEESLWGFLKDTVVEIATETEDTEKKFMARWAKHFDEKRFFRFNVEQGLQGVGLAEYERQGEIESATHGYLTHTQRKLQVRDCVQNLRQKQNEPNPTLALDIQKYSIRTIQQLSGMSTFYEVPPATLSSFAGREVILRRIKEAFNNKSSSRESTPPIVVLHAMGGQGKSQIALKHCRDSRSRYRGVFWINTSSIDTVQREFEHIAQKLDPLTAATLDSPEKKVRLVLDALAQWEQEWLLIFDNYDQPDKLKIQPYLPSHGNGSIIITSRREDSRSYARPRVKNAFRVPSMEHDGGLELLENLLGPSPQNNGDNDQRKKLLQRLGGLALAIDQAAAYISFQKLSISDFLQKYEGQRKKILQHHRESAWEYNKFLDDSENETAITAYTTWEMSFCQVAPLDRTREEHITRFLCVSAFLQPLRIGEHIFHQHFNAQPTTLDWVVLFTSVHDGEDSDQERSFKEGNKDGAKSQPHWNGDAFWEVVRNLEVLSLVDSTGKYPENVGAWFSIHPVIRDWIQIRMTSASRTAALGECMRLIGIVVATDFAKVASPDVKQELLSHVDLLADSLQSLKASDLAKVAVVGPEAIALGSFYKQNGQFTKAVELLEHVKKSREAKLNVDDPDLLASQHTLAVAYRGNGQIKEGVELLEHVVKVREKTLAQDHKDLLASQHGLAIAYLTDDQYGNAAKLLKHVVKVWEATVKENHPSRLASQHELGIALRKNGQMADAVVLLQNVVKGWEASYEENHPWRLASQHALGITYREDKQIKESVELLEHVVRVKKAHLVKDSHSLLGSQHELGITYLADGQTKRSIECHEHVVEAWKIILAENHPDRLVAEHELANSYQADGRITDATKLLQQVGKVRKASLKPNHPNCLATQRQLAVLHLRNGQISGAMELLEYIRMSFAE